MNSVTSAALPATYWGFAQNVVQCMLDLYPDTSQVLPERIRQPGQLLRDLTRKSEIDHRQRSLFDGLQYYYETTTAGLAPESIPPAIRAIDESLSVYQDRPSVIIEDLFASSLELTFSLQDNNGMTLADSIAQLRDLNIFLKEHHVGHEANRYIRACLEDINDERISPDWLSFTSVAERFEKNGERQSAQLLYQFALSQVRKIEDVGQRSMGVQALAGANARLGNRGQAGLLYEEAIALAGSVDNTTVMARLFEAIAGSLLDDGFTLHDEKLRGRGEQVMGRAFSVALLIEGDEKSWRLKCMHATCRDNGLFDLTEKIADLLPKSAGRTKSAKKKKRRSRDRNVGAGRTRAGATSLTRPRGNLRPRTVETR